jgi:hypothetical protein
LWPGSNGAITRRTLHIVSAEKQRAKESGVVGIPLQRYLMGYLMEASFPVREIGTVMTLLHARYELEDLIRMEDFQGQDHL